MKEIVVVSSVEMESEPNISDGERDLCEIRYCKNKLTFSDDGLLLSVEELPPVVVAVEDFSDFLEEVG